MVVVKIKVITDVRRKTKSDGTVVYNFVAVSSENKIVHCNMKESSCMPQIHKEAFLAVSDCRICPRNDSSLFLDMLEDTKVV